jgi:RIO kinase 1
MRRMFHTCRLVHADLSEYNILYFFTSPPFVAFFLLLFSHNFLFVRYFKGTCYIIDVGQAVEHDHPHALEFLRMDCYNITNFFR